MNDTIQHETEAYAECNDPNDEPGNIGATMFPLALSPDVNSDAHGNKGNDDDGKGNPNLCPGNSPELLGSHSPQLRGGLLNELRDLIDRSLQQVKRLVTKINYSA